MPQDNLHPLLVKLENLLNVKGFDPEDRALMKQNMIEVSNYEALLIMRDNPVFKALLAEFTEEIRIINRWILDSAVELAGVGPSPVKNRANYLIAKKEVLKSFIDHYSAEPVELMSRIEERADHFLKKYKIN
jgi:hypothetical protein